MPDDEDCQEKWEAVIGDPEKYVSFLVGQVDDEEQRAERDEENYHDTSEWEQTTMNYFLSYHEVQAHLRWIALRPAEAEAYKRFQVSEFIQLLSLCQEPIAHPFNNVIDLVQSTSGCGRSPGLSFGVWSVWGHRASESCGERERGW